VYVVPGRRRYHIDSCRQLAGRSKEELTFEEAREEGFSPCTACLPDTALAARAVAGGLVTAEGSETEPAAGGEFDADADAAASEDERGAVSGAEWSAANGSLSSVTPVQRQALEDLTDEEPARPATEPGEGSGEAEPAYGGRPAAGDETTATEASDAAEYDDEPDDPDDAATAAEVPPQATRHTPAATATAGERAAGSDEGSLVRILSGTKRYHRPDCALIEDIGDDADDLESLSRAEAKARGCTPCLVCQPDKEPATRD